MGNASLRMSFFPTQDILSFTWDCEKPWRASSVSPGDKKLPFKCTQRLGKTFQISLKFLRGGAMCKCTGEEIRDPFECICEICKKLKEIFKAKLKDLNSCSGSNNKPTPAHIIKLTPKHFPEHWSALETQTGQIPAYLDILQEMGPRCHSPLTNRKLCGHRLHVLLGWYVHQPVQEGFLPLTTLQHLE